MKGSRVLLLATGAVRDDGAMLALGAASMLAAAELVRRGVAFVEADLAREARPLPPLLAELKGSRAMRLASVAGLEVHPYHEWPTAAVYGMGREVPCPALLHTTQKSVDQEQVQRKRSAICAGEPLAVSIVRAGGRFWVFDGHHTLVAYLQEGLTPRCRQFDTARGGDRPAAPRFRGRGSASRKPSVDVVLDLAGFDRKTPRRSRHAQRLGKLSQRKLAAVQAVLSEG